MYVGDRLEPLFAEAEDLIPDTCYEIAEAGGERLTEVVRENTPVSYHGIALGHQGFGDERQRVPGTLKASWYQTIVRRTSRYGAPAWESGAATDDPVAPFVENDTRAHDIKPKKPGGRLRFRLWPTGELVYARRVRHPGTLGAHMLLTAVNRVEQELEALAEPALVRWAKRAERGARRQ